MKRMKSYTRILPPLALLGCLCTATPALAQVYSYYPPSGGDRPVQWYIDGGVSITSGQTSTYFNDGWAIGGGVIFKPDPHGPFALRADLDYAYYSATSAFINASGSPGNSGYMDTLTGSLDGLVRAPISPSARFYAMAGIGIAWRGVYLGQGGYYCNPFWYYCGGGGYYASDYSTNFAWNAGLGVDFLLPYGQSWFIEARYERIETSGAPTEVIPIRFGWRF
ncbi:MAG TPA: hypothetical protein VEG26_04860 [Steroidobacteraceae bacterium]|nr:hypothetical protein [Steroidobacteraceae bacterium]